MFWDVFKNLCDKEGITPNALGKIIGIGSATISQWKQGSEPTPKKLQLIAEHFNVSTDYLLGREENTDSEMPSIYFSIAQNARDAKLTEHDVNVINNMIKAMMDEYNKDKK